MQKSLFVGLLMYSIGLILFAFATKGWMMFAFSAVYCLGGLSGPSMQGIISSHVPSNEQGELQGALTSLMSATSIVGPPLMTSLYAHFSKPSSSIQFPGAPFILGAALMLLSTILAFRSLKSEVAGIH
jgi:DHA1 family tetracycline resistance protein-like MFS transporter